MTDYEKVVTGLKCIKDGNILCKDCGYNNIYLRECHTICASEAIALLDELKKKNTKNRPERLVPCTCGCKKREHWYGAKNSENSRTLKCCKCGFTVSGRNEIEVHKKWNEAVKNNGTS